MKGGVKLTLVALIGQGGGVAMRTLNLAGPELVTNGEFTSGITSWTDGSSAGGAISHATNALRTVNTTGTARARQPVTTVAGLRYGYAAQNVGAPVVAGSFSLGTTAGGTDYLTKATNPAIAQRTGIVEFIATTTTTHIQLSAPIAGTLDWDHVSMRNYYSAQYPDGTIFTDDFSGGDGPMLGRVTTQGLPWRLIIDTNATQVLPSVSGGKMVMGLNASGASAGYPYLDLGTGKAKGLHCDMAWTGAGASCALVSVAKSGSRLTIADIVLNSLHIVFTDLKVDISYYVGGVLTTETVNYITHGITVVTDGRTYENVGWTLTGNTLSITLPTGVVIERTLAAFNTVVGECGVFEHYYSSPASGTLKVDNIALMMGNPTSVPVPANVLMLNGYPLKFNTYYITKGA